MLGMHDQHVCVCVCLNVCICVCLYLRRNIYIHIFKSILQTLLSESQLSVDSN